MQQQTAGQKRTLNESLLESRAKAPKLRRTVQMARKMRAYDAARGRIENAVGQTKGKLVKIDQAQTRRAGKTQILHAVGQKRLSDAAIREERQNVKKIKTEQRAQNIDRQLDKQEAQLEAVRTRWNTRAAQIRNVTARAQLEAAKGVDLAGKRKVAIDRSLKRATAMAEAEAQRLEIAESRLRAVSASLEERARRMSKGQTDRDTVVNDAREGIVEEIGLRRKRSLMARSLFADRRKTARIGMYVGRMGRHSLKLAKKARTQVRTRGAATKGTLLKAEKLGRVLRGVDQPISARQAMWQSSVNPEFELRVRRGISQ